MGFEAHLGSNSINSPRGTVPFRREADFDLELRFLHLNRLKDFLRVGSDFLRLLLIRDNFIDRKTKTVHSI